MTFSDDELSKARRDLILARRYFWRAAAICRRKGMKRAAVAIAGNIDTLADSLILRGDALLAPTRDGGLVLPTPNP
jgi:hypothetical protein